MKFDLLGPARLPIAMLTFLGLWRLNNKWNSYYPLYTCTLHIIISAPTIASIWACVFTASDISQLTKSLFVSLVEAAFLGKFINMLVFKRKAVEIIHTFGEEQFRARTLEETNLFKTSHRVFRIVQLFYIGSSLASVIVGFPLMAFISKSNLLYPAWFPYNLNERYMWFTLFFQLLGMVISCAANTAIDSLQCFVLHQISLTFRLIGHRFENLGKDLDNRRQDEIILKELVEIIRLQQHLSRLTSKCEKFVSCPVLLELCLSSLILCFTAYELVNISVHENPGAFLESVHMLMVMALKVYLPCYYAHEVTLQSGKVCHYLYSSKWVEFPPKTRRIILLYMEFLKYPVYMRAGDIFTFGLPIFAKTVNYAYSFFAILIKVTK